MKSFANHAPTMRRAQPAARSSTLRISQRQPPNGLGLRLRTISRVAVDDNAERFSSGEAKAPMPHSSGSANIRATPTQLNNVSKFKLPARRGVLASAAQQPSHQQHGHHHRRTDAGMFAEAAGSVNPELIGALEGGSVSQLSGSVGSRGGAAWLMLEDFFYCATGVFLLIAVARPGSVGSRLLSSLMEFLMSLVA